MKLLVTGGAGYIGSVVRRATGRAGHEVTVARRPVDRPRATRCRPAPRSSQADLATRPRTRCSPRAASTGCCTSPRRSLVGESVQRPELYWHGNVVTARSRCSTRCARHGMPRLVFSSTAAVYGEPEQVPIPEDAPTAPDEPLRRDASSPIDHAIGSYARAHGLAAVSLRYFNVAGRARPAFGERHAPETHLIPLVLQVAAGSGRASQIFGDDYPTPDGTCVRDYIHVDDLAEAHLLALAARRARRARDLQPRQRHRLLGPQVVEACRAVTGAPVPVPPRPADRGSPAELVAVVRHVRGRTWAGCRASPTCTTSSRTPGASFETAAWPPEPGSGDPFDGSLVTVRRSAPPV